MSKLLSVKDAKNYLRETYGVKIAEATLNQWRHQKKGPRYMKLPESNRVFYSQEALDAFIGAATEVRTIDLI
jgi:hypothetical protein